MGATHSEVRLCKSQMAPIWKFLCSRVTTKDKAKALRSQMEERCVTDTVVTWSPLMTRRGTAETYRQRQPMKAKDFSIWNHREPLLKSNSGMLKLCLEVLRNGCRHPSSKLGVWVSLNPVFIWDYLTECKELENQRKKSKKMELIERNRLMDLARTERANRTRLLEHCLADMNDVKWDFVLVLRALLIILT